MKEISKKEKILQIIGIYLASIFSIMVGIIDSDFYWQSLLGENILQNHDFYAISTLTWGDIGKNVYLDHEWLTNIIFSLFNKLSIYGPFYLKLFMCTLLFLAIMYALKSFEYDYSRIKFVQIVCILLFYFYWLGLKPHVFGEIGLILTISFLHNYKKTGNLRYLIFLLLNIIVVNNMHSASSMICILLCFIYYLFYFRNIKCLVWGILYCASLMINPYGYKLIQFNLSHNNNKLMKQYIVEWTPFDAKQITGIFVTILIFILIINLIRLGKNYCAILISFIALYFCFQSIRFAIFIFPVDLILICMNKEDDNCLKRLPILLIDLSMLALLIFSCINNVFMNDTYKQSYLNQLPEDLQECLISTNSNNSEGLFTTYALNTYSAGIKPFMTGAYPAHEERFADGLLLQFYGSDTDCENIINKYNLTKFLFYKYNSQYKYDSVLSSLYVYLDSTETYEKLYDDGRLVYFVKRICD